MRIWRYFFLSFIKTVLAVLSLILILYLIITYIENSLYYFKGKSFQPNNVFFYYFWQIPDIALQILPFSVLISGVILHWSISRSGEISALRSAGMSLWRISFPFICGAIFYVIVHLVVSEFIRPYSFKKFYHVKYNLIEHVPEKDIFIKTTWIKSQSGILHFSEYNNLTQTVQNPEFFALSESNIQLIARSDDAKFDQQKNTWILENASVTQFQNMEIKTTYVSQFETDVHFAPPKILKENVDSNELSFFELSKLVDVAKRANIQVSSRVVDLYFKLSVPFSSLLFLLFTIPFALQRERQEASYFSILVCLGLTSTYWLTNLVLKNLASNAVIPPILAAWGLNIIFGILGIFVIAKLDKPA